jgi:hypothetical protein
LERFAFGLRRVKGAKKERKEGKEKKKREKATVKRTRTPDTD